MVELDFVTLNNDVKMPMIGFGVYQIPNNETAQCVLNAIEAGYRSIDTAQWYGNESGVGTAIESSGIDRSEFFITTKIQSGRNVERSIEESLKKLKTDYIDLMLIHWVMGNDLEIYRVMEKYYRRGIFKSIGLSNFYGRNYSEIVANAEIKPQVIQQEVHVLHQNEDFRKICVRDGIQLEAWSPLAAAHENIFQNPVLKKIAAKHRKTTAQIMLRFLIDKNIVAIPKSSHKNRMIENISVFDFKLDSDDITEIKTLDRGKSLFGWY